MSAGEDSYRAACQAASLPRFLSGIPDGDLRTLWSYLDARRLDPDGVPAEVAGAVVGEAAKRFFNQA